MGKPDEALGYLERAAKGMPEHSRVQYNLGLLLQVLQRDSEAEAALQRALGLEPANMDYLYHWLTSTSTKPSRRGQKDGRKNGGRISRPEVGRDLLDLVEQRLKDSGKTKP